MRNKLLLGAAAIALIAPAAMAQETTSTIRGAVTAGGQPVAGASISVVNTANGARSQATTASDGRFSFPGLQPGGPYTLQVNSPQGNKTVTDIYTIVQQPFELPVDLSANESGNAANGTASSTAADTGSGQDIVVTASAIARAGNRSNGPQTVLTQKDVSKVASVNRDIRDIERRDPLASLDLTNSRAVSFAGVNPRFNRFTINGVQVGDQFGLNPDASPTARGPIPYDAIGQVSVSEANYDFRQGNFQGGAVDVLLLAGTNDYHATGFYSQSRDSLQGTRIGSNTLTLPPYNSQTYGLTVRGPIIRDKLFFMVSAERNTDPRPVTPNSVSGVPGLTDALLASVTGPAQSVYNYNPGTILSLTQNRDEKVVGQIDWNISDSQKLKLSYINAFDQSDSIQNSSVTSASPAVGLSSDAYRLTEVLHAGIAQLNSDWSSNFSTEARFLYRSYKRGQDPEMGRGFAQFRVCTDATDVGSLTACTTGTSAGPGSPVVAFGPDISRQTNTLNTDTYGGSFLTRLRLGGHELKLLGEFNRNSTTNNFLQYSAGGYYFDSLADFNAKRADQLILAQALNGQPDGAQAKFRYDQWTFGIQDDWQVSDALNVSYGIRYDLFAEAGAPAINNYFLGRYGFPNTQTYKGLDNFQPRVSFNYRATDRLKFRGGFGIFGNGSPDIYLSNSFSNTILSNRVTINRATAAGNTCTGGVPADICVAALNNVSGTSIPSNVAAYVTSNASTVPLSATGALARNFRLPSIYKANLSADYTLFGIDFGADYLFTRTREGIVFTDIRSQVIGTLPDGRPRYNAVTIGTTLNGALVTADNNYDILLSNTTKGRSHVGDVRASKTFDWGLSLSGSYARQNVKDVAAATSSTILSNYGNQAMGNPNFPAYGTSDDQIKWRFTYQIGYDHAFFRDYRTVIQLFGETKAGRPYSFTMQDNTGTRSSVFGTLSNNDRYLLYVPTSTNDPLVSYDNATTQTFLDNLINTTQLKNYRGTIAAKNIARSRANTRIDLHLEQELPTFIGKSRVSLFGDIENLPNLLNHNWGGLRQIAFPQTAAVVNVQCLAVATPTGSAITGVVDNSPTQPCAQYRYSAARDAGETGYFSNSLYLIRLGVRATF